MLSFSFITIDILKMCQPSVYASQIQPSMKLIEKGTELRKYQDVVIENVFQYRNKHAFLDQEKKDTQVRTFDGQFIGFLTWEDRKTLVGQVSVLGPIAGLYGRIIEQFIIHPKRKTFYIPERVFAHSIESARVCLKKEWLQEHPEKTAAEQSDSDSDDDTSGPTVEKQKEKLRRQIRCDESYGVSRFEC